MIRYAACAGQEMGQAKIEGRDFDFFAATKSLLKSVYPHREDEEIKAIVADAADKMGSFVDRDLIRQTIQKRNPSVPQETIRDVLDKFEGHLQTDKGRKLIVRYSVAEVVGSVFGPEERAAYLLAVIEGKAN
jgi:nitrogen-specific signal transduction histidine kinase